jgi:hypothetical protein
MRSIEEQRAVEIRAGFSPKPVTAPAPEAGTSPSLEPESPSPSALLDGPTIQRGELKPRLSSEVVPQDGIVSFGK